MSARNQQIFREALGDLAKVIGPDIKEKLRQVDASPIGHGVISLIQEREAITCVEDAFGVFVGAVMRKDQQNKANAPPNPVAESVSTGEGAKK